MFDSENSTDTPRSARSRPFSAIGLATATPSWRSSLTKIADAGTGRDQGLVEMAGLELGARDAAFHEAVELDALHEGQALRVVVAQLGRAGDAHRRRKSSRPGSPARRTGRRDRIAARSAAGPRRAAPPPPASPTSCGRRIVVMRERRRSAARNAAKRSAATASWRWSASGVDQAQPLTISGREIGRAVRARPQLVVGRQAGEADAVAEALAEHVLLDHVAERRAPPSARASGAASAAAHRRCAPHRSRPSRVGAELPTRVAGPDFAARGRDADAPAADAERHVIGDAAEAHLLRGVRHHANRR